MNKIELENDIANYLCNKDKNFSCTECSKINKGCKYNQENSCRISVKTQQQLDYISSSSNDNIYLEACPGSGKTEVVGMKAALEIAKWNKSGGISILSFTNDSTNVIKNRVNEFTPFGTIFPHYIGTISSFIHKYIVQPFGYKIFDYFSEDNDSSFRIISEKSDFDKSRWLKKYKTLIHIKIGSYPKPLTINQFVYDARNDSFDIINGYQLQSFRNFFISNSFFCYEGSKKYKTEENYNYWIKHIKEQKKAFFKDGFATFGDMNYMAYLILKGDNPVCKTISQRFPLIIVDECQDLSCIEIRILELLQKSGSTIHLVGDLNQSIYKFKGVNSNDIKEFTLAFKKMNLTNNFRSCQSLVDFSSKLIPSTGIRGICKNKFVDSSSSLLFFESNSPDVTLSKYISLIEKLKIDKNKVSVLVKQNSMKSELLNIKSDSEFLLLTSIVYWKYGNVHQKIAALSCMGKQISKWMSDIGQADRYYCPKCINSLFNWRLFLLNLLNECISNEKLYNFDVNFKKWHKVVREEFPKIIVEKIQNLKFYCTDEINLERIFLEKLKFNVPSGMGNIIVNEKVSEIIKNSVSHKVKIETIHQAKGCTYDSNLVISSNNSKSKSGYWKQWLEDEGESKRIGYVASTRAKYLLVWGVPVLKANDKNKLFEIGFKNANDLLV